MKTSIVPSLALTAAALFLSGCSDAGKTPAMTKDAGSPAKAADPKAADTKAAGMKAADMKPEAGKIACFGANACSGQSQCNVRDGRFATGSKGNACAGQNECKGKGWLSLSKEDCATKGGQPL